jgi:serine/threonine-protein kinase RsbW
VLKAPPGDVNTVHSFIQELWDAEPAIGDMDKMAFETALIELASNVIEHTGVGNGVSCVISIKATPTTLSAQLSDTAEVGDIQIVGRGMPDEDAESGRGIALVQMLVDELGYNRVGESNVWSFTRTRVE